MGGELFHATDGVTDIEEDRHDEAKSHFSQFCQRAKRRRCGVSRLFWVSSNDLRVMKTRYV